MFNYQRKNSHIIFKVWYLQVSKSIDEGWVKKILEEFWMTFAINHISTPASPNDGIFQGDTKEKVDKILERVKGSKLMKVKQGVLGLKGNKYFVWKDWGPLAWWDFDEKDKKVVSSDSNPYTLQPK